MEGGLEEAPQPPIMITLLVAISHSLTLPSSLLFTFIFKVFKSTF